MGTNVSQPNDTVLKIKKPISHQNFARDRTKLKQLNHSASIALDHRFPYRSIHKSFDKTFSSLSTRQLITQRIYGTQMKRHTRLPKLETQSAILTSINEKTGDNEIDSDLVRYATIPVLREDRGPIELQKDANIKRAITHERQDKPKMSKSIEYEQQKKDLNGQAPGSNKDISSKTTKRASLYQENLPTFFVGPGNNSELIIDCMKKLGWEQVHDKLDDSVKMKWTQTAKSINWNGFREGIPLNLSRGLQCQLSSKLFEFKKKATICLQAYERSQLSAQVRAPHFMPLDEYVPLTYKLDDKVDRDTYFAKAKEGELWICKPISMNQGKGIYLVRDPEFLRQKLEQADDGQGKKFGINKPIHRIIQKYISNPLTINKRKFDIRCYMLIASTKPLLVLFHHGYLRLSMEEFTNDDENLITHLTNQFFQKKDPKYKEIKEDTTWTMEKFNDYVNKTVAPKKNLPQDWVLNEMTRKMHQIMLQVIHSSRHRIKRKIGYFAVYGYDFMIDENMKTWLIEINVNPALTTNTEVLLQAIPPVIEEGIHIAIECFEKARHNKKILPLDSIKDYTVLYYEKPPPSAKLNYDSSPTVVRRSFSNSPSQKLLQQQQQQEANNNSPNVSETIEVLNLPEILKARTDAQINRLLTKSSELRSRKNSDQQAKGLDSINEETRRKQLLQLDELNDNTLQQQPQQLVKKPTRIRHLSASSKATTTRQSQTPTPHALELKPTTVEAYTTVPLKYTHLRVPSTNDPSTSSPPTISTTLPQQQQQAEYKPAILYLNDTIVEYKPQAIPGVQNNTPASIETLLKLKSNDFQTVVATLQDYETKRASLIEAYVKKNEGILQTRTVYNSKRPNYNKYGGLIRHKLTGETALIYNLAKNRLHANRKIKSPIISIKKSSLIDDKFLNNIDNALNLNLQPGQGAIGGTGTSDLKPIAVKLAKQFYNFDADTLSQQDHTTIQNENLVV